MKKDSKNLFGTPVVEEAGPVKKLYDGSDNWYQHCLNQIVDGLLDKIAELTNMAFINAKDPFEARDYAEQALEQAGGLEAFWKVQVEHLNNFCETVAS